MSTVNMWEIENSFYNEDIKVICGVDEAGRGPLAGPVCAAAVILPRDLEIPGLTDSKKLTDKKRRELFPVIKDIKYPAIAEMPIISSNYWNMVHGAVASDVPEDKEGMQTMRVLGKNMAYFLKCIEAGKKAGISLPEPEKKEITNFIR